MTWSTQAFGRRTLDRWWLLTFLFVTASASASSSRLRWAAELDGSYKSILSYQKLRQARVFPRSETYLTEQRLRLRGHISSGPFRAEMASELSGILQSANDPLIELPELLPAWDTRWMLTDSPTLRVVNRLDRAFLQWTSDAVELKAGKQVVAIGVGRLFSAVSQTPRQPFVFVDQEFPVTEDAISLTWNGALALDARFLPRSPGQEHHNFHLRAKGSKGGYDVALTTGRSDDKSFAGLEAAGNIGDSLLRGEVVGYDQRGRSFWQGLVGVDTVISSVVSAELEAFHNGFYGVSHRSSPYRGSWYAGTHWAWTATPLVKVHASVISNLADPSGLFHLLVNYAFAANMEFSLGQYLGIGARPDAEFGGKIPIGPSMELGLPDLTYVLWKWYF